jgi:hypothetical protein
MLIVNGNTFIYYLNKKNNVFRGRAEGFDFSVFLFIPWFSQLSNMYTMVFRVKRAKQSNGKRDIV